MIKQKIKDFVISPIFPSVLFPLFKGVVIVFNIMYPQNLIPSLIEPIILVGLVVWIIVRWSLEYGLSLIKEYKYLMNSLRKHDKTQAIEQIFSKWNPSSPPSHITARKFFDSKRIDIDIKSNELNTKLDKLISNPYRLLYTDTTLIGIKFMELLSDYKKLYEYFGMWFDSESILVLKEAIAKFPEIKTVVPEDILFITDFRRLFNRHN